MSEKKNLSQTWKTPNELIRLHRYQQKKKALTARLVCKKVEPEITNSTTIEKVICGKRRNPFAKETNEISKKHRTESETIVKTSETLLHLIESKSSVENRQNSFENIFKNDLAETEIDIDDQKSGEHLPIDWSLKSRLRILCETSIPASNLKTSQEASALSGFVRCIDRNNSSNSLDLSFGALFNQSIHYWQHPYLPWLTLFPRNAKCNIGFQIGDVEKESLAKEWCESFRGLFQLLRARQCPYFYLCANTFTVLFRAAGIGGIVETHAFMSPTTRGMRSALNQEEIEYTMPLKENKEEISNTSLDDDKSHSCDNDEDEEEEEEKWLESLGINENEIKKISSFVDREKFRKEMSDDFNDSSIVLIEGIECQAFFNFLLNAKSTITTAGRLAGIPPTLLSNVAFPKATMQSLSTRSSKVRNDGEEYFSLELKGAILPHVLPYVNNLLCERKEAFSITLASNVNTLAFSKASLKIINDMKKKDSISGQVFGKENLSDCGLQNQIVNSMCNIKEGAVSIIDRMCYTKDAGFIWS